MWGRSRARGQAPQLGERPPRRAVFCAAQDSGHHSVDSQSIFSCADQLLFAVTPYCDQVRSLCIAFNVTAKFYHIQAALQMQISLDIQHNPEYRRSRLGMANTCVSLSFSPVPRRHSCLTVALACTALQNLSQHKVSGICHQLIEPAALTCNPGITSVLSCE